MNSGAGIGEWSFFFLQVMMLFVSSCHVDVLSCPLSPRLLFEDSDSGLFSVTLFRKAVDDFKHKARENKQVICFY